MVRWIGSRPACALGLATCGVLVITTRCSEALTFPQVMDPPRSDLELVDPGAGNGIASVVEGRPMDVDVYVDPGDFVYGMRDRGGLSPGFDMLTGWPSVEDAPIPIKEFTAE